MQIATDVTNLLVSAGIPAMIGLQVWIVKEISGFKVKFTRLDTWAFGPTGTNGANGRLAAAEQDIEDLKSPKPVAVVPIADRRRRKSRARDR